MLRSAPLALLLSTPTTFLSVFLLLLQTHPCTAGIRYTGSIPPGLEGDYGHWIDKNGLFLVSNSSRFAFGFTSTDTRLFYLSILHRPTNTRVWSANPATPVNSTSRFAFTQSGDAYLESPHGGTAWSAGTHGATSMVLLDSGNLVLLRQPNGSSTPFILWQSFDHPTDSLLPGQNLTEGVALTTAPNDRNVTFHLRIQSGDVVLTAGFRDGAPQQYWTLWSDPGIRTDVTTGNRDVRFAAISGNHSWNFYGEEGELLTQVIISSTGGVWAAALGRKGLVSFVDLADDPGGPAETTVPRDPCGTPVSCTPYKLCTTGSGAVNCDCPDDLAGTGLCTSPDTVSACGGSYALREVRGVGYVGVDHAHPTLANATLAGCKAACTGNCSCSAALFEDGGSLTMCFLFDQIGSLRKASANSRNRWFTCFIKVPDGAAGGDRGSHVVAVVAVIAAVTVLVVCGMISLAVLHCRRKKRAKKTTAGELHEEECSDGDGDFLESVSRRPVRYTYRQLEEATEGFSKKLGHGGFGSVYLGEIPDGTRVAVKKLERVGQGRKEFRAEVSTIGRIHHLHLVGLRGFCAEGAHRLLAYEYMPNGSLDKWIFGEDDGVQLLDWPRRYAVALGTAKGLAYLHGDCEAKIVHCDIKPENVLLDEGFEAKVSDFGLAKLMAREQSNVFTTLRGTRGYLAPEWILCAAISEKSDVYSYGMVLLETVAGRKSFEEGREHLPSHAYRMVEQRREWEVLDGRVREGGDRRVAVAVRVALWCLQDDAADRPTMGRVVQMLEGVVEVGMPPPLGFRPRTVLTRSTETSSSSWGTSECISVELLSGPR